MMSRKIVNPIQLTCIKRVTLSKLKKNHIYIKKKFSCNLFHSHDSLVGAFGSLVAMCT